MFLAVLSCAVFSACKDKYADMEIFFYSSSGEQISSVDLLIDNFNEDKNNDTARIAVKFEGISNKDIGNIAVNSAPQELATISNYVYNNEYVYFDVQANTAGTGKIKVTHLSTGNVVECDLKIGQKSNNVNIINSTYVLSIPDVGERTADINANEIVALLPNASTDKVYFKPAQNRTPPIGIEYLTEVVEDESLIYGFRFNSSVANNTRIELYPVTTMKGYDNTSYESSVVQFAFIHTLKDSDITLKSDDLHQRYLDDNQTITLIANDPSSAPSANYGYNNLKLSFYEKDELVTDSNIFDTFYSFSCNSSDVNVAPNVVGEEIVVVANAYTNSEVQVKLAIAPKCAGEIDTITRTIKVKGEVKPKDIEVYMQGELINDKPNVDLFDYYLSSGSGAGAMFRFRPIEEYSFSSLQGMKLAIDPEILNARMLINNNYEGTNVVYTDDSFSTSILSASDHVFGSDARASRNNKYVLEIRVGNTPMKFYFDNTLNKFISEPISKNTSVYVKYVETDITSEGHSLALDVQTYYGGDLTYLQGIKSTSRTINFNRQDGVKELIVNAGELNLTTNELVGIKDENGDLVAENVYLNRLNGGSDTQSNSVIFVGENGVIGERNIVSDARFTVKVTGGNENPLEISQYGKDLVSTEIVYDYVRPGSNSNSILNSLILHFDANTDIGNYKITFSHANGFTHTLNCYVYQDLLATDIDYTIDTNEKAFKNYENGVYKFADYPAHYIVASKQSLNAQILLDQMFINSNIIKDYNFVVTPNWVLGDEAVEDYVAVEKSGKMATLNFKKGSYKNDENNTFTLELQVELYDFTDILTQSGSKVVSVSISFFIYDEIHAGDAFINTNSSTLYWGNMLGTYDKDASKQDLVVSLSNENLWNYVQPAEQTDGENPSYNLGDADKKVSWIANKTTARRYLTVDEQDENSISLNARSSQTDNASEDYILTATFKQFNSIFTFPVRVRVLSPVVTESLSILSEVKTYNDNRENHYINLKAGEPYKVEYQSISSRGEVTHPGIVLAVANSYGNANYNSVYVDGDRIIVRDNIVNSDLKLIIFARDALNEQIPTNSSISGLDDPASFLMTGPIEDMDRYKGAYIVLDLILSNGDENNPYLIENADDFWEINTNSLYKTKHFKLMTNVDLSNTSYKGAKVVEDFSGTISTNSYSYIEDGKTITHQFQYSLFGINLNAENRNLFKNFTGTLENVSFSVNYDYDFATLRNETAYLGVFDELKGTLRNVAVISSGKANLTGRGTTYFGALVGKNSGQITYDSINVVGTSGNINLSGDALISYGGLVGLNEGKIDGFVTSTNTVLDASLLAIEPKENNFLFGTLLANQGVLGDVNITANLSNSNSSVGGIVGTNSIETIDQTENLNEIYSIKNAYVTGKISANATSNVGGVIGKNITPAIMSVIEIASAGAGDRLGSLAKQQNLSYVQNVKSCVAMVAGDNVGGIVGSDEGGSYQNCNYQILAGTDAFISANNNVGGIAGTTRNGWFNGCSVMSYRHNYDNLADNFTLKSVPDIYGNNNVGGIVGFADNDPIYNLVNGEYFSTAIRLSSVNAHIKSNNQVGGLFCTSNEDGQLSFVIDSYFMGKLDGNYAYYYLGAPNETSHRENGVVLANNRKYFYNNVYSVNVVEGTSSEMICEEHKYPTGFAIKQTDIPLDDTNLGAGWGYSSNLNGGYIFISQYDDAGNRLNIPIFDLMPEEIFADIKTNQVAGIEDLVHFDYYMFRLDASDNNYVQTLNSLNAKYNSHSVQDFLTLTCKPADLGNVRLYLESSNANVVSVSNDRIIINGVGKADLYIRSLLNSAVYAKVTIDVSLPVGEFELTDSPLGASVDGSTVNIAKGGAKQLYVSTEGELDGYSFATSDNVSLKVSVKAVEEDGNSSTINPYDYITISGIAPTTLTDGEFVIVGYQTPLSISVKEYVEGVKFEVSVQPFTEIKVGDTRVPQYLKDGDEDLIIKFFVQTFKGATDISLNFHSAVYYPNDTTVVSAFIETDTMLDDLNYLIGLPTLVEVTYTNQSGEEKTETYIGEEVQKFVEFILERHTGKIENGIQTEYYRIVFNEDELISNTGKVQNLSLAHKINLRIVFEINGKTAGVNFEVLPQRIQKMEIKNFMYVGTPSIGDVTKIRQTDILRPSSEGLMIVNPAPQNGYYDYLEISDITGMEEVSFAQLDNIYGNRLSVMDAPSSDGKGIKLVKQLDNNKNQKELYVATRISNDYSSREHIISVRAYLSDGTLLEENTFILDVRMLPSVSIEYRDPHNRTIARSVDSDTFKDKVFIALGVDSTFRIETRNSDGNVNYNLSLSNGLSADRYFNFIEGQNGFYTLVFKEQSADLLGKTLTINLETRSTNDNGNFELSTTSLGLKITNFVINNVSVSNSRVNFADNSREIYGNYGRPIDLEFYFAEDDISFFNPNSSDFLNTIYRYDKSISADKKSPLGAINEILNELNNNPSQYVSIIDTIDGDDFSLEETKLTVNKLNNNAKLKLAFSLKLDEFNNWQIEGIDYVKANDSEIVLRISWTYDLRFTNISSYYEPEVIKNAQDFLNMQSGEDTFYILATDITLRNYTPQDVNIKMFDGNGHKITIESFALFNEESLSAGLFKHVYPNMIVANTTVEYPEGNFGRVQGNLNYQINYFDLCNNIDVNYSSALFGGLTATNEGIITNCYVTGRVALRASVVEAKSDPSNYSINFNIGGLVGENTLTGRITNSGTDLEIFAGANVGGLSHSNAGKIASSNFNGTIYAYNSSANSVIGQVGGFVVENTGEISMSAVEIATNTLTGRTLGNLSAKDPSAGFVFSNSGKIYDCYAIVEKIGFDEIDNTFYGFVSDNSGTIENAFTFINGGTQTLTDMLMFTKPNSTGITNSIEIVSTTPGYNNRVEGLITLPTNERFDKTSYEKLGFVFGDNVSAVWTIQNQSLPTLVGLNEINRNMTFEPEDSDRFYGLREIERIKTELEDGQVIYSYKVWDNNLGTKENPFLIYDVTSWNEYFNVETEDGLTSDVIYGYYRIVADIDFNSTTPVTSTKVFSGNLQGNNMVISGILLFSSNDLGSLGLFKQLTGINDSSVDNAVRNVNLQINSIQATKTEAVGALAGIVQDFNLYNINLDSASKIIVGKNAVGGIAGIVRGSFDIEKITSNVGVNSTRAQTENRYSIYTSRTNGVDISANLSDVYYSGSVFGILDGYRTASISANREISSNYYNHVTNVTVNGNIVAIGETAGALFGFVGERVYVQNSHVNLTGGKIYGTQYSSLAVGENRGVLDGIVVNCTSSDILSESRAVVGGVVGLNLTGLVMNSNVEEAYLFSNGNLNVSGGIVGRNVDGYVVNNHFNGQVNAKFTGGIIGTDYNQAFIKVPRQGTNAINADCLDVVLKDKPIYTLNGIELTNYSSNSISIETLTYLFENLEQFYSYRSNTQTFNDSISYGKVLGLFVGASSENSKIVRNYGLDDIDNPTALVFNADKDISSVGILTNANLLGDVYQNEASETKYDLPYANIIRLNGIEYDYVCYPVGVELGSFDNWNGLNYSGELLVLTNELSKVNELTLSSSIKGGTGAKRETIYIAKTIANTSEEEPVTTDLYTLRINNQSSEGVEVTNDYTLTINYSSFARTTNSADVLVDEELGFKVVSNAGKIASITNEDVAESELNRNVFNLTITDSSSTEEPASVLANLQFTIDKN